MARTKYTPENIKKLQKRGFKITLNQNIAKLPEYIAWRNMRYRCNNSTATGYDHYGGRGIMVCGRWKDSLKFLLDLGPRPGPGFEFQLNRLNNDGNYDPKNCAWSTKTENMRNRSNVKINIEDAEEIRELHETGQSNSVIAGFFGISHNVVSNIVNNRTWIA